jgi:hypothetical protein
MAPKFDAQQARQVITIHLPFPGPFSDGGRKVHGSHPCNPVEDDVLRCYHLSQKCARGSGFRPLNRYHLGPGWLLRDVPASDIKIPTSMFGISMEQATSVGFWDTGPEAVGEDMHIFIIFFLLTGGNLHVETIYSPASQLNVIGSRRGEGEIVTWLSDMCTRYTQGMRDVRSPRFSSG